MLDNAKVTLYEGLGRMIDPHTVEIVDSQGGVQRHTTKYILIATGGRATLLDIPGKVSEGSRWFAGSFFWGRFLFEGFFWGMHVVWFQKYFESAPTKNE